MQQLAALRLELRQQDYPQIVLSGMVLVFLLGLGAFIATRRQLSMRLLRPCLLWFSAGFFLLYCSTTLLGTEPVENALYVSHVFLVAACYALLPMIPAATVSGLSAVIMAGVVLLHTPPDPERLLSTICVGLLISFLTVYGHGIREEHVEPRPGPAFADPPQTLARIQECTGPQQQPSRTALLVLEVELYRNLLDVYGPLTVSQLMERLERQVRVHLSSADYVWRYGEARFLVLLTNVDAVSAARQGQHLLHLCNEVEVRGGDPLQVCGGLAFLNERTGLRTGLPAVADLALARLYGARRSGAAQFISNSLVAS